MGLCPTRRPAAWPKAWWSDGGPDRGCGGQGRGWVCVRLAGRPHGPGPGSGAVPDRGCGGKGRGGGGVAGVLSNSQAGVSRPTPWPVEAGRPRHCPPAAPTEVPQAPSHFSSTFLYVQNWATSLACRLRRTMTLSRLVMFFLPESLAGSLGLPALSSY